MACQLRHRKNNDGAVTTVEKVVEITDDMKKRGTWKLYKHTAMLYNIIPADVAADAFWSFWEKYMDSETDENKRDMIGELGREVFTRWQKIFHEIYTTIDEKRLI